MQDLELIANRLLEDPDSNSILESLKPDEARVVLEIFQELMKDGKSKTLDQCWSEDYEIQPPTFEEFVNDPYYLGDTVGENLYQIWKDKLSIDLGPKSKVITIVFTGPIGVGKTYAGGAALLYKMAVLAHMVSPQKFYGTGNATPIIFGIYTPTLGQAEMSSWNTVLGFMQNSPFFLEKMGVKPDAPYKSGKMYFPKGLRLIVGSRQLHALGGNLFGHLFDETEFRIEKEPDAAAYAIHTSLMRRMESRFMQKGGTIPGLSILCSSKNRESSFLSQFVNHHVGDETVSVHDYPIWVVKKEQLELCGKTFKVDCGDNTRAASIVTTPDTLPEEIEGILKAFTNTARIVDVPIEYFRQFRDDVEGSLRDIAGEALASSTRFISNPNVITRNLSERKNPVKKPIITMTVDTPEHIHDFIDTDALFIVRRGIAQPKFHPECLRFLHVDLSRNKDKTGIAVAHIWRGGANDTVIESENMNIPLKINSGKVYVDMLVAIQGSKHKNIDYEKIRIFILWLRKCGMHIGSVSMDDYQSTDMMNILSKMGINTEYLSLDRSKTPYYMLKNLFIEDRIDMLQHDLCIEELAYLEDREKKIDHASSSGNFVPPGPLSKDVADALCGSVYKALTSPYQQIDIPALMEVQNKEDDGERKIIFSGLGYGSHLIQDSYKPGTFETYNLKNE